MNDEEVNLVRDTNEFFESTDFRMPGMPLDHVLCRLSLGALLIALIASTGFSQTPSAACGLPGAERWQSTRPSPLDSSTLTVGAQVVSICYSRPRARGRSIDSLVPLRRTWRTGANEPTIVTLTGRLSIGGVVLDAGRYVLLTVPERTQWRLVFATTSDTEPAKMFSSLHQVAIGSADVESLASPVEQFTIRASPDSVAPAFFFDWGTRRVRVPVRSPP
jgi:hypothetical protein